MFIAWSCLIMGVGAMGVSIYYSVSWFISRGMPVWLSWVMAVIYVGFANVAFEFAMEHLNKAKLWRSKQRTLKPGTHGHSVASSHYREFIFTGVLRFIGWAVLAGFSMFCTVGGQYDQLMVADNTEAIASVLDYTKIIDIKEKELLDLNNEIESLTKAAGSAENVEERWTYKGTTERAENRLDEKKQERKTIISDLEDLYIKQNKKDLSDDVGVNTGSFYMYISDILKGSLSPLQVQFYSALFPSVVFDILSPICLTIFVFYWSKRKAKK